MNFSSPPAQRRSFWEPEGRGGRWLSTGDGKTWEGSETWNLTRSVARCRPRGPHAGEVVQGTEATKGSFEAGDAWAPGGVGRAEEVLGEGSFRSPPRRLPAGPRQVRGRFGGVRSMVMLSMKILETNLLLPPSQAGWGSWTVSYS